MICPKCYQQDQIKKNGVRDNKQRYLCKRCNHEFKREFEIKNAPKILVFDIETAPNLAFAFGVWKQNIGHNQILNNWFMLSWVAKWLNDCEVMGEVLTSKEAVKQDDGRIAKSLWKLIDEADVIVAHNCDNFDRKRINTRFLLNGINPPSPYQTIDTLKVARDTFAFDHNKLDALAGQMGIDHKIKTDFGLWEQCYHGDQSSLDYMLKYNKKDVLILEEVYLKLLPWVKSHPNWNNFTDKKVCANCGSTQISKKGKYRTQVNNYQTYKCDSCGAFSRETKKSLASVAR